MPAHRSSTADDADSTSGHTDAKIDNVVKTQQRGSLPDPVGEVTPRSTTAIVDTAHGRLGLADADVDIQVVQVTCSDEQVTLAVEATGDGPVHAGWLCTLTPAAARTLSRLLRSAAADVGEDENAQSNGARGESDA